MSRDYPLNQKDIDKLNAAITKMEEERNKYVMCPKCQLTFREEEELHLHTKGCSATDLLTHQAKKVYCVVFFYDAHPNEAYTFDRHYKYLGSHRALWRDIKMSEITEVSTPRQFGHNVPAWLEHVEAAMILADSGYKYVTIWREPTE